MLFGSFLINPRDYPVLNVPLIYIVFVIFVCYVGIKQIIEGFRRTLMLIVLVSLYWAYYQLLVYFEGIYLTLEEYAYIIEPTILFSATGAVTTKRDGAKIALTALVFTITLSNLAGLWIYFIGEPFSTIRTTLHASVGGNLIEGSMIRWKDLNEDVAMKVLRNTGLSYSVFTFSYQLGLALVVSSAAFFYKLRKKTKIILCITIFTLALGVMTNTERATILSFVAGMTFFYYINFKKIIRLKTIAITILLLLVFGFVVNLTNSWYGKNTMMGRSFSLDKISVRLYMVIPAVISGFQQPLGNGSRSLYYENEAKKYGWVDKHGRAVAAHNHFANIFQSVGILGVIIIFTLFITFIKKIIYINKKRDNFIEILLVIGCIACVTHSLTHNGGFFRGDFATQIVFALLWGTSNTAKLIKKF